MQIGQVNNLTILRRTSVGFYLGDEESDVLLPNKYVKPFWKVGDEIQVFIYKDSEDRLIATTRIPYLLLNTYAYLKVKEVNRYGAFLDWGLEKDLMVPYSEQQRKMMVGNRYFVYLLEDTKTNRLIASAKLHKWFKKEHEYKAGDEIEIMVWQRADAGFYVIINNSHRGMMYENEIFRKIRIGEKLPAFVKNIRPDGKIDVSLQKQGYANIEPNAAKILAAIESGGGYLPLHDKSDPITIQNQLNMSKKTFKKAVGALYKKRLIKLEKKGISLAEKE